MPPSVSGPPTPASFETSPAEFCYLGRFGRAVDVLAAAVDRDPKLPMPLYGDLVRMLLVAGRPAEAGVIARRGIDAHGESGELLCGVGAALRHRGEAEAAVVALRHAIAGPAPIPAAHGEMALAQMALGDCDAAVKAQTAARYLSGEATPARHIGAYRTSTVKAWAESVGAPYEIAIPAGTGHAFRPDYGETPPVPQAVEMPQPEVYLAEIPDASIIGGQGIVLTRDGAALTDIPFWPIADRLNIAESSVPFIDARGALVDVPSAATTPNSGRSWCPVRGSGSATTTTGSPSSCRGSWSWSDAASPRTFHCSWTSGRTAWRNSPRRCASPIARAAPVVEIEPDTLYRVGRLIVPSSLAWLVPNLRDHLNLEFGDNLIAAEAIEFVRERLGLPGGRPGSPGTPGKRRLYIARRASTSPTRLANGPVAVRCSPRPASKSCIRRASPSRSSAKSSPVRR